MKARREGLRHLTLNQWADHCYGESAERGWWTAGDQFNPITMASKIALIHSEVSEMLEGLRKGLPDVHLPHRSSEEVEAADIFIRLMDYCGARNLDILSATIEKLEYNITRADHQPDARAAEGGKQF